MMLVSRPENSMTTRPEPPASVSPNRIPSILGRRKNRGWLMGNPILFNPDRLESNAQAERGFTLFEIMVALGIFMVGIVGVLSLLTTALGMHKEAVDREVAAMAADEVLAIVAQEVPNLPRDPVTSKLAPMGETEVPGRPGYNFQVEFQDGVEGDLGLIKAKVTILWKSRGRSRVSEFISFVDLNRRFHEDVRRSKQENR